MTLTIDSLFLAWTAGPIVLCLGGLQALQWLRRQQPRRAPFSQWLERTPGGALLERIYTLSEDITILTVTAIMLPLVIYAGYITHLFAFDRRPELLGILLLAGVCLVIEAYLLSVILKRVRRRRALRLDYIGELTVGQQLNRLMLEGYRVFHDVPGEGFNIDHVLVGPAGIFAIETQTRSYPVTRARRADATVTYDGRMLHFPMGSEYEIIDQAKRQSKWLARWLSREVDEPLTVRAIVTLPGWFVKRSSPEGPPVVNPQQFASLFAHITPRTMPPETTARIVHLLDQRCNDLAAETILDDLR